MTIKPPEEVKVLPEELPPQNPVPPAALVRQLIASWREAKIIGVNSQRLQPEYSNDAPQQSSSQPVPGPLG
jgi:hypothetical protein